MDKVLYNAEHRQKRIDGAKTGRTKRIGEKSIERTMLRRQASSEFTLVYLAISLVHSLIHSSNTFIEHLLCS